MTLSKSTSRFIDRGTGPFKVSNCVLNSVVHKSNKLCNSIYTCICQIYISYIITYDTL